jgi:hypothetical protein
MDGSNAWWNCNGPLVMHSKSLMTSTKNPRGEKMGLSHSMLGGTWTSFVLVMLLGHPWLKDAKVGTPCRRAFGL